MMEKKHKSGFVNIVGNPNVGKSTLINRLVKKRVASTANKAGHTRAQQWIRINPSFELLDTPGILSPHYDDHQIALNLALIGAMKEEILPFQEIMDHLIAKLVKYYPEQFRKRYSFFCSVIALYIHLCIQVAV